MTSTLQCHWHNLSYTANVNRYNNKMRPYVIKKVSHLIIDYDLYWFFLHSNLYLTWIFYAVMHCLYIHDIIKYGYIGKKCWGAHVLNVTILLIWVFLRSSECHLKINPKSTQNLVPCCGLSNQQYHLISFCDIFVSIFPLLCTIRQEPIEYNRGIY